MLGDRYIAGIFDGNLIRGLLWLRIQTRDSNGKPTLGRAHQYVAPSWSWASQPARNFCYSGVDLNSKWPSHLVRNHGPRPIIVEKMVHAKWPSAETSQQVFGALSGGYLVLRTLVYKTEQQDSISQLDNHFGQKKITLDNGRRASIDVIRLEYGDICLMYMGIYSKYVWALMVVPQGETNEAFMRIGCIFEDTEWFSTTQSLRLWEEIKLV